MPVLLGGEPMAADIPAAPCDPVRARREMGGQLEPVVEPGAFCRAGAEYAELSNLDLLSAVLGAA